MITILKRKIHITDMGLLAVILLIISLLIGCAATYQSEEQEGGITGTGNDINCDLQQNKKRKECINRI